MGEYAKLDGASYKREVEGNTRLIAAAPDLRSSLRFLVDMALTEPGMNIYRAHIQQARELLASLDGREDVPDYAALLAQDSEGDLRAPIENTDPGAAYTPGPWHFDRRGQLRNARGEVLASFPIYPGGLGGLEDAANLRAVACTPAIIGAARRLLGRLDTITTLQYAQGAERAEREALRAVLGAALGDALDDVALQPDTPAASYAQTPGTVGDVARAGELPTEKQPVNVAIVAAVLQELEAASPDLDRIFEGLRAGIRLWGGTFRARMESGPMPGASTPESADA